MLKFSTENDGKEQITGNIIFLNYNYNFFHTSYYLRLDGARNGANLVKIPFSSFGSFTG